MFIFVIIPYFIIFAISLGTCIGCVSAYSVVRKWSLLGDIMSHAALPGIVFTFLYFKTNHTLLLLVGGAISSILSAIISFYIQKHANLPKDTSFALVLSWFFTLGILGMSIIQKKSIAGQSLINNFIYGNIVTLSINNVYWYVIIALLIILIFYFSKNIQQALGFDKEYAKLRFKNVTLWENILLITNVCTIVIGIQAIGILLMSSLVITPGIFARILTNSYFKMIIYSIITSIVACLFGILIGIKFSNLPTGPIIALFPIILFFISIIFLYIKNRIKKKW